jgi:predicted TIM-barrel enzyme
VTAQNCREQLEWTDAAIVGSSLKDTGNADGEVSAEAVAQFMSVVREVRGS